jgi:hypothetical protein
MLATAATIMTFVYYRSKEKQMLIEKGMSYQEMAEFLKSTKKSRDNFILLKLGIIVIFFGVGMGAGMLLSEMTGYEEWIGFFIVTMTGGGLLAAHYVAKKEEAKLPNGNSE